MLRLNKTVCFAEEMTRLVLTKPQLYTQLGLDKPWEGLDVRFPKGSRGVVLLRIQIRGFSRVVYANCQVLMDRDGYRDEGQCRIQLRGKDPHNDAYWCVRVNDEMRYFGRAHEITAGAFELDDDLAEDLKRAGIETVLELEMLAELEVGRIFLPSPETDPYVLTHPNLAEYAERVVFDKLQRLQPSLKEMGIELQGPGLSRAELAALV